MAFASRPLGRGEDASTPQVALDPAGDAVVVWPRSNGTNTIVQAASRPAGGSFGVPVNLSAAGQSTQGEPEAALDSAGNAVVVWSRSNGTNNIVQAASRPAGGSFGAPVNLSAAGENAYGPQAAFDQAGDAVAIWVRSNGTNDIVQAPPSAPRAARSAPP